MKKDSMKKTSSCLIKISLNQILKCLLLGVSISNKINLYNFSKVFLLFFNRVGFPFKGYKDSLDEDNKQRDYLAKWNEKLYDYIEDFNA